MREALAALLLLTGAASAEESLRFFPPEGFSGVHVSDSGEMKLTEYVRDGEALDDWTEAVTLAEISGTGLSAVEFVERVKADKAATCEQSFDLDPEVTENEGRVSTMSIHACPNYNVNGRSEVALLRVIEGNDRLYAIQRAWVNSPPREELDAWTARLREIALCDESGCR